MKKHNFNSDSLHKKSAPSAPDTSTMNDSACQPSSDDISSTYTLSFTNEETAKEIDALTSSCESGHDEQEGGRNLCEYLRQQEQMIHSFLSECESCETEDTI